MIEVNLPNELTGHCHARRRCRSLHEGSIYILTAPVGAVQRRHATFGPAIMPGLRTGQ